MRWPNTSASPSPRTRCSWTTTGRHGNASGSARDGTRFSPRPRKGRIRHVLTYHPDRLMRQPRDLEELLQIADDHDIRLHGQANRRDLADPDDRFFLRIELAHACRSSDDTSRRLVDSMVDRAKEGRPHTGRRRYGYDKTGTQIIPEEAAIVREVFQPLPRR